MLVDVNSVGRSVICPECKSQFRVESFHAVKPGTNPGLPFAEPGDSSDRVDESEELSLKSFGRFELKKVLGKGGFGRVYLAWDPNLERMLALKVAFSRPENGKQRERVLREAKAQLLLRHDAIVPALECDQVDGYLYILFEYVEGETLSSRLRRAPVERCQAVEWVRDLADALAFAHAHRVIHRDVKPHNILIDLAGRPHITDFGLVHWMDDGGDLTKPGSFIGTIPYMAPELLIGHGQDGGSEADFYRSVDQYSLGVVLYELLTGHRPFEGRVSAVLAMKLAQEPPCPSRHDPSIPPELAKICLKALSRNPDDRHRDCASFAMALTKWMTESQGIVRPVSESKVSQHVRRRAFSSDRRRKTVVLSISASLLLLTATAVVFVFSRKNSSPDHKDVPLAILLQPSRVPLELNLDKLSAPEVQRSQGLWARELGIDAITSNSIGMQFCLVPPGQYKNRNLNAASPFFIGQYEVTELQYEKIVGSNPSTNSHSSVDSITYAQALNFCQTLSALDAERSAGREYRLPTEMEWEFACRANLSGSKKSAGGALRLEDMLGGVSEWCSDWFDRSAKERVVRGGSDENPESFRQPEYRHAADPEKGHKSRGFRVIMELKNLTESQK